MTQTATYQLLGITDEQSTCDCCGKTNLKRVVALRINNGAVVRYGTTCAAKALRGAGVKISKGAIDEQAVVIAFCQRWLDAGWDASKVANRCAARYGFSASVKNGALRFPFATITRTPDVEDEYNAEWLAALAS